MSKPLWRSRLVFAFCLLVIALPIRAEDYRWKTIVGSPGVPGSTDGINAQATFQTPYRFAIATNGTVYVTDISNCTIRRMVRTGSDWMVTTIAGAAGVKGSTDGPGSAARFFLPNGIALDASGCLYVADSLNRTIRKMIPQGDSWTVSTIAGTSEYGPFTDGVGRQARFGNPDGVVVGSAGELYVTDSGSSSLRKLTLVGKNWVVSTIIGMGWKYGTDDGTNENARLWAPDGIAIDGRGTLYVTDRGAHTVRKVTPIGTNWVVSTIAGLPGTNGTADGFGRDARFNRPGGVAVDKLGNLFIADRENHAIRRITPIGTNWLVTTIGGLAGSSGAADGLGTNSRFNWPFGITIDDSGVLYVADFNNYTVRIGEPVPEQPPELRISHCSGQAVLSWPAAAGSFFLERAYSISDDCGWEVLNDGLAYQEGNCVLTNIPTAASVYFRLRGTR